MPQPPLDRTDRRLLELLQREGRLSNAELAERVSLSASPCLRRVQRLEQAGVIAGYSALVDPRTVGLGLQAFVRVQLDTHSSADVARFAEAVGEWDEVVACYALTGDMDYLLQVYVEDLDHYSAFVMDKLLNATGVGDMNSSFVLQTVKQSRELPLGHLDAPAAAARARIASPAAKAHAGPRKPRGRTRRRG